MTDDFENEATDYLLNRLPADRRVAFERRLEQQPGAREALKACADSLAGFACEVAAPEPLPAADQQSTLAAILAETRWANPAGARRPGSQRWLWPAAAALLLGLNLLDFERPVAPVPAPRSGRDTERQSSTTVPSAAQTPSREAAPADTPAAAERPVATSRRGDAPGLDQSPAEVTSLRERVAELQWSRDRLQAEYDMLVRRFGAQATLNRDLNRLTTMELVDAASYARGERKGLVTVARGILTEPGIVVAVEPPAPPGTLGQATAKPAYAWSVYDEKEQRGFLNLYDLPQVSGDHAMLIWVRTAGSADYQPVGEVPREHHGRSGSVQYALPGVATPPAEILITIEPRGAVSPRPTGPTVLRGP